MSTFEYKMFDENYPNELAKYLKRINEQKSEIIEKSEQLCKKFIDKVENGKARSKETYSDCKELYQLIQELRNM